MSELYPHHPQGIPWDEDTSLCERCEGERFEVLLDYEDFPDATDLAQLPRLRMSNAEWLEMETILSFAIAELQQKGSIYLAQQMREVSAKLHSARAGI